MIRALLILLAACAPHPMIAVRGDEVLHHLDELGQTGSTHVVADRAHYGEMPTPRTPPPEDSPLTVEKAISATLFFGGLAGVGLCVVLCEDHKLGYSVALGSGALVAGVFWAVLSGKVRD